MTNTTLLLNNNNKNTFIASFILECGHSSTLECGHLQQKAKKIAFTHFGLNISFGNIRQF